MLKHFVKKSNTKRCTRNTIQALYITEAIKTIKRQSKTRRSVTAAITAGRTKRTGRIHSNYRDNRTISDTHNSLATLTPTSDEMSSVPQSP